jgi:hypothetical protein
MPQHNINILNLQPGDKNASIDKLLAVAERNAFLAGMAKGPIIYDREIEIIGTVPKEEDCVGECFQETSVSFSFFIRGENLVEDTSCPSGYKITSCYVRYHGAFQTVKCLSPEDAERYREGGFGGNNLDTTPNTDPLDGTWTQGGLCGLDISFSNWGSESECNCCGYWPRTHYSNSGREFLLTGHSECMEWPEDEPFDPDFITNQPPCSFFKSCFEANSEFFLGLMPDHLACCPPDGPEEIEEANWNWTGEYKKFEDASPGQLTSKKRKYKKNDVVSRNIKGVNKLYIATRDTQGIHPELRNSGFDFYADYGLNTALDGGTF